jgi:hypothetical protein
VGLVALLAVAACALAAFFVRRRRRYSCSSKGLNGANSEVLGMLYDRCTTIKYLHTVVHIVYRCCTVVSKYEHRVSMQD